MQDHVQDQLRGLYYAIDAYSKDINFANEALLDDLTVSEYGDLILRVESLAPNLIVPFFKGKYISTRDGLGNFTYNSRPVLANMAINLGILKAAIEKETDSVIVQEKSFSFIQDAELKAILERDYKEIQRNIITQNWKSAIILSGGAIETILLDLLLKHEPQAKASQKAPTGNDLTKWELNSLIEVSIDIRLVELSLINLSHSVRKYRNLVHPGNEVRNKLKVKPEEAKIAVEALNILIRDLS